jgi:hypothetical protein
MEIFPNAITLFIEWFRDVLFKSENNTLPIVGDVIVKQSEQNLGQSKNIC